MKIAYCAILKFPKCNSSNSTEQWLMPVNLYRMGTEVLSIHATDLLARL
jgi:hypothetical protein